MNTAIEQIKTAATDDAMEWLSEPCQVHGVECHDCNGINDVGDWDAYAFQMRAWDFDLDAFDADAEENGTDDAWSIYQDAFAAIIKRAPLLNAYAALKNAQRALEAAVGARDLAGFDSLHRQMTAVRVAYADRFPGETIPQD